MSIYGNVQLVTLDWTALFSRGATEADPFYRLFRLPFHRQCLRRSLPERQP